jgi:ABC-type multidrug transport system ATPase subunit/DNA-binding beta-propeller fold protein YncE
MAPSVLWSLDNISLSGRRRLRLDRVTVSISEGFTAVLGSSGVGKTSLLNLLVEFERPTSGRIEFTQSTSDRLPIYWVPPQHGLWPHLTVREHLTTVLPTKDHSKLELIDQLLSKFDLHELASAKPDSLSLGERSRLNVARAIATQAKVLVMDEPLAHVDSTRRSACWRFVREYCAANGTSVVFATHSAEAVLKMADQVICLQAGRVTYSGAVDPLYEHPASQELAELLGPCNWLAVSDATGWFNRDLDPTDRANGDSACIRPERLTISAETTSPLCVEESRFCGATSEVVLRDERNGGTRRFVHSSQCNASIRPGDRVVLKLLALLIGLMFVVGCNREATPTLAVKHETTWLMPPADQRIPAPRGMTVSPDDEYLVLDNVGRVLVFDKQGDLQKSWWMPEYSVGKAEGICVLKDGRIAVADTHYHRVVFFDCDGNFTGTFGQKGSGPGDFVYPVSITQDPGENIYVCEYGHNDRVQKFRPDGQYVLSFGGQGVEPGQFMRPCGIVWHDHKLYVGDAFNNRVQVFSDDGKFVRLLNPPDSKVELRYPYGVAMNPKGELFIVEYMGGCVTKFSQMERFWVAMATQV